MKFYKSTLSIENGKYKYGNLPSDFVIGINDIESNLGYFTLLSEVQIPTTEGITEISPEEYSNSVTAITKKLEDERKLEQDAIAEIIFNKNKRLDELEATNAMMFLEIMKLKGGA